MFQGARGWLIFLAVVLAIIAFKLLKFPFLVAMGRLGLPLLLAAALILLLVLRPWGPRRDGRR